MPTNTITITLPDGTQQSVPKGTNSLTIAQSISSQLAKAVLAAEVNSTLWDATRPLEEDATLRLLTWEDKGGKHAFWHSSAHLMAEALQALYPEVKFGIGPALEQGFYYDVDLGEHTLTQDDLVRITAKMHALAKASNPFHRRQVTREEAIRHFTALGATEKVELAQELPDDQPITFYQQGTFIDLCRGPHLPHTGYIKAIKLTNISGAYWRGDQQRKQLTRIYGITFPKASQLQAHEEAVAAAKERDHRKLGKELGLFTFSERVGLGLPLWLPRGTFIKEALTQFMQRAQEQRHYQPVHTPHIGHKDLYVTSGHYQKYGAEAFQPIATPHEGELFFLKPMNCPHHCEIYKSAPHSYRDLPLRLAEFGTVYRYEQHGELHGLTRTRGFTQDDAHIFCRPDQVKEEFTAVIELVLHVFTTFGFTDYQAQLSLRDPATPSKYMGDPDAWDAAEQAIQEAAHTCGLPAQVALGEAAFYGPKLDFMVKDALGRTWQLGTVQLDYQLPQRFKLTYKGHDNQMHTPILIHRAPFGSLERFIGLLLEHTAGHLPLWLAPEQVAILPISDKYTPYAQQVATQLRKERLRVHLDTRTEKIGRKIRDSSQRKIPYMLILGEREVNQQVIAVRQQGKGDIGTLTLDTFIQRCKEAVAPFT